MRLRSGLAVLRRGPSSVQIGTDPRWAVRVDDLTEVEADALVMLAPTTDLTHLADTMAAGTASVSGTGATRPVTAELGVVEARSVAGSGDAAHRLAATVAELAQAGLATATPQRRHAGPLGAEQVLAGLLGAPDPALARGARCVGIVGLGPVGLAVATTLAASGVGTLLLDDVSPVRSADAGPCGYRWDDVGSPREEAAARAVRDVAPRVAFGGAAPDVLVLVAHGAVDPEQAPGLLAAGLVHLPVVCREGDVVVGPLVLPGSGPCLRCLDLHRADDDPQWPELAVQLAGLARHDLGAGEIPAVAAVSAGVAAAAVLAHLDGRATPLRGTTVEVSAPHALPVRRPWAVHPSCGCTALPSLS